MLKKQKQFNEPKIISPINAAGASWYSHAKNNNNLVPELTSSSKIDSKYIIDLTIKHYNKMARKQHQRKPRWPWV